MVGLNMRGQIITSGSLAFNTMKKIVYIPTLNLGVIFWRIEMYAQQLVKHFKRCAVFVSYMTDPSDNVAWDKACVGYGEFSDQIQTKLISACRNFDYVIFQKIQNKEALFLLSEYKKKYPKVKFGVEVDDCLSDVSPSSIYQFKKEQSISASHIEMSDFAITTTDYLSKQIKMVNPDIPIHVAPNCINKDVWDVKLPKNKVKSEVRVGYVGGAAHDEDLLIAYKAILPLLDEDESIVFVVRSGGFRPDYMKIHKQIDFKQVSWHTSVYPQKLADLNLNIGLAPLRDTEFNRCKSEIKWLEWASLNVPVIASNIETYNKLDNILLTSNDIKSWTVTMKSAIEKIKSGKNIFKGLKEKSEESFNLRFQCERLLDFLDTV